MAVDMALFVRNIYRADLLGKGADNGRRGEGNDKGYREREQYVLPDVKTEIYHIYISVDCLYL